MADTSGMKILGPFLSLEDPDTFFWMRGFPDVSSREPMKAKFYEGELWKRELENILLPMLDKYEVVLVEDPEDRVRWIRPTLCGFHIRSAYAFDTLSWLHFAHPLRSTLLPKRVSSAFLARLLPSY